MAGVFRLTIAGVLLLTLLGGGGMAYAGQVLETESAGPYAAPFDRMRGVHSYAEMLAPALDSVVRVNVLRTQSENGETRIVGSGNGSGSVIDADEGLVLTNAHVVEGDRLVFIETPSGEQVRARIIGLDAATDLALLQAELAGIPEIRFADSALLAPGDIVFAIGFPRGLDKTISSGIVSGVGRQGFREAGSGRFGVDEFIQTDASINPGNSGGPLVDSAGRVIGVNTFLVSRSGESAGLNFAVPSRVALSVVRQLREYGRVRRTYIGLQIDSLSRNVARELGVSVSSGALVTRVLPGSPADQAGLRVGDVITGASGERIDNDTDFVNFWLLSEPGEQYPVFVRRGEQALRLVLTPAPIEARNNPSAAQARASEAVFLGATLADPVQDLNNSQASAGVRVSVVPSGSEADERGLRAGDLITEINRRPVRSVQDLVRYAQGHDGVMIIQLSRNGESMIVLAAG